MGQNRSRALVSRLKVAGRRILVSRRRGPAAARQVDLHERAAFRSGIPKMARMVGAARPKCGTSWMPNPEPPSPWVSASCSRERLWEAPAPGGRAPAELRVKPGETCFTPAHTGSMRSAPDRPLRNSAEPDVTYRLWDYGRPREIHVDRPADADLGVHPGACHPIEVGRNAGIGALHALRDGTRPLKEGDSFTPAPENCHPDLPGRRRRDRGEGYQPGEVWLLPDPASSRKSSPPTLPASSAPAP